jgi:hypothetical protein
MFGKAKNEELNLIAEKLQGVYEKQSKDNEAVIKAIKELGDRITNLEMFRKSISENKNSEIEITELHLLVDNCKQDMGSLKKVLSNCLYILQKIGLRDKVIEPPKPKTIEEEIIEIQKQAEEITKAVEKKSDEEAIDIMASDVGYCLTCKKQVKLKDVKDVTYAGKPYNQGMCVICGRIITKTK